MVEKLIKKIGYYSLYEITDKTKKSYKVDSGKTLFVARLHKTIVNPYRDVKEFDTEEKARQYITIKLSKKKKERAKKLESLPKSLYLILMKEASTGKTFVKVGITTKKFVARRFSKEYGYDGYVIEKILRRIMTPKALKLEKQIKDELNKKRSIKKYRPILESFSGYSECYDYLCLNEIIKIFDVVALGA